MLLNKLLEIIETTLPADSAMEGDKIGLQIKGEEHEIQKILVTLEVTDEVIHEAIISKFDCIITFHPLIYTPLSKITYDDRVGNLCSKLIKNSIALISVHTTFDVFSKGTSQVLMELLGLKFEKFLVADDKYKNKGMGVIASTEKGISAEHLLERVHNICSSPIRFSKSVKSEVINKIAIVGGSGTSFMKNALSEQVQAFITSDITYHRFHDVFNELLLIDPGHYEMEQFVPSALSKLLKEKTNNVIEIQISQSHTNPVSYYPNTDTYNKMQIQNLLKYNRND